MTRLMPDLFLFYKYGRFTNPNKYLLYLSLLNIIFSTIEGIQELTKFVKNQQLVVINLLLNLYQLR